MSELPDYAEAEKRIIAHGFDRASEAATPKEGERTVKSWLIEAMALATGITKPQGAYGDAMTASVFFSSGHQGSAVWPNKRTKDTKYARKRRYRGGRFKW